MAHFPEDDEIEQLQHELAQAEDGYDRMARDMMGMDDHRRHLRKQIELKQIDPVVKKLVETAQNAGHALGANEALANRIKFLEKRIEVRDTKIAELESEVERTADRDEWVESSAEWEQKYKKLSNSRRKR